MDDRKKLDEKICISSLSVQMSEFDMAHRFETKNRKIHNSFGLILDGSVDFISPTEEVKATAGNLIFIPEGIRYASYWTGNPKIRFLSLHFHMVSPASAVFRSIRISKIEKPTEEMIQCFLDIKNSDWNGDVGGMTAMSAFYRLCSLVYPSLSENCRKILPPVLQRSTEYINENYRNIAKVSEVSKACFISESHLYHLFQEHLGTSPVAYLNSLRIQKAMELLITTEKTMEEIATELGFHSTFYFRETFKSVTGTLPSKYRKIE